MFDAIGPIGAISTPEGNLEFGNLGVTDCCYFRFDGQGDFLPVVIYTAEELQTLVNLIKTALLLSEKTSAGQMIHLGVLPSKPVQMRVTLLRQHSGQSLLLLRLVQDPLKQDIMVAPEQLMKLVTMGQTPGSAPLRGALSRESDGSWRIGGESLSVLEGLSPGSGYWGEYLHPDEVEEGEELEVWPVEVDGKQCVGCFRQTNRWAPSPDVTEPVPQESDNLLSQGEVWTALTHQKHFGLEMIKSGKVNAAWCSKLALSALLGAIKVGDDKGGQAIWLGRSEDPLIKSGIKTIEAGQSSSFDFILYQHLGCYYHSLNPKVKEAEATTNQVMKAVFQFAHDEEPNLLRLTLNNWYLFLKEIHEGQPPESSLNDWNECCKKSGLKVVPKTLCFPQPYSWLVDWGQPEEDEKSSEVPVFTPKLETAGSKTSSVTKAVAGALLLVIVFIVVKALLGPGSDSTQKVATRPPITVSGDLHLAGIDFGNSPVYGKPYTGFKQVKIGPRYCLYSKEDIHFATAPPQGFPADKGTSASFASNVLYANGQPVLRAGDRLYQLDLASREKLDDAGIKVLTTDSDEIIAFTKGKFRDYVTLPGNWAGIDAVHQAKKDRDIEAFKAALNPRNAQFRYLNGKSLLETNQLGDPDNPYAQAIIDVSKQDK